MNEPDLAKITHEVTKKLVDNGRLIEAGWVGYKLACKLEDAPPEQLVEMRRVFFAGAMHLLSSVMSFLEPGQEATDKDMDRMRMVSSELSQFQKEFEAHTKSLN